MEVFNCPIQKPWLCFVQDSIVDRLGPISCDFVEIVRPDNDFDIERSPKVRSKKYFELENSDFVSVKCWTDDHKYALSIGPILISF